MRVIKKIGRRVLKFFLPELQIFNENYFWDELKYLTENSEISKTAKLYFKYQIRNSKIGAYSYVARNSQINNTEIGKFCSIGTNFISGMGMHPINGISTSPMFYSTQKQNGISITNKDKVTELKNIKIGNDVYIGMNVTILDGVTIGHGAVIGAGAVVSKNIPPYAVAIGCPIKIVKYRFTSDQISKLLNICWWDWSENQLREIESKYFEIDQFITKHYKNENNSAE